MHTKYLKKGNEKDRMSIVASGCGLVVNATAVDMRSLCCFFVFWSFFFHPSRGMKKGVHPSGGMENSLWISDGFFEENTQVI